MLWRELLLTVPCHRLPERCWHINGKPMLICSRCLAILLGYSFTPLFFFVDIAWWWAIVWQLPMLVDGFSQAFRWRMSNNYLRTATGLLSGAGLSLFIARAVQWIIALGG